MCTPLGQLKAESGRAWERRDTARHRPDCQFATNRIIVNLTNRASPELGGSVAPGAHVYPVTKASPAGIPCAPRARGKHPHRGRVKYSVRAFSVPGSTAPAAG